MLSLYVSGVCKISALSMLQHFVRFLHFAGTLDLTGAPDLAGTLDLSGTLDLDRILHFARVFHCVKFPVPFPLSLPVFYTQYTGLLPGGL